MIGIGVAPRTAGAATVAERPWDDASGYAANEIDAWIAEGAPQCGYCQSGQIMAAVAFLKEFPDPTDNDIDANITNICRCGTYQRLRSAIHRAADMMKA